VNLLRCLVIMCLALSAIGLASPQASAREVLIGSTSYEARPIRDTINIGGRGRCHGAGSIRIPLVRK